MNKPRLVLLGSSPSYILHTVINYSQSIAVSTMIDARSQLSIRKSSSTISIVGWGIAFVHIAMENDSNDEVVLEDELQALMERNDLLVKENDILTAYLYRCKQNIIQQGEQGEDEEQFSSDLLQISDHETPRALAQRDKMEAILNEEAAIEEDLRQIQEHAHKDIQSLKEVLEEARLRSNEIKKDAYEFRRDVVIGAESMQTGNIEAEKVVNHIEEKLKNKVGRSSFWYSYFSL